jgi:diketogulonate reductase-like aldo/keto reductase
MNTIESIAPTPARPAISPFNPTATPAAPLVKLNDGTVAPQIGFGLYELREGDDCTNAVTQAIAAGYRHFDTAQHYYNEHTLGSVLKRSGIPRDQFYVTSKTPWNLSRRSILVECEASLIRSGLEYFDLYLIHWPTGDVVECWHTMEELQKLGLIRSLGVSNFSIRRFEEVFFQAGCSVPVVNQIEFHPFYQQPELTAYCRGKGIRLMAYSPLARASIALPPVLTEIAARHGKSPQQVMLRWSLQQGNIIIPKSRHPDRMKQNLQLGDFALTADEMAAINALDRNENVSKFRPGGYF